VSGPVWRLQHDLEGTCDECLRPGTSFYVEGEVGAGELEVSRRLCPACYARRRHLETAGELGDPSLSPAYVGRR
jgi:hypothetical protein